MQLRRYEPWTILSRKTAPGLGRSCRGKHGRPHHARLKADRRAAWGQSCSASGGKKSPWVGRWGDRTRRFWAPKRLLMAKRAPYVNMPAFRPIFTHFLVSLSTGAVPGNVHRRPIGMADAWTAVARRGTGLRAVRQRYSAMTSRQKVAKRTLLPEHARQVAGQKCLLEAVRNPPRCFSTLLRAPGGLWRLILGYRRDAVKGKIQRVLVIAPPAMLSNASPLW